LKINFASPPFLSTSPPFSSFPQKQMKPKRKIRRKKEDEDKK